MHVSLYLLILTVLFSGVLMMRQDISIFNYLVIPPLIDNVEIQYFFETLHVYSCRVLALLVMLHILAVIKHEIRGVRILNRML